MTKKKDNKPEKAKPKEKKKDPRAELIAELEGMSTLNSPKAKATLIQVLKL